MGEKTWPAKPSKGSSAALRPMTAAGAMAPSSAMRARMAAPAECPATRAGRWPSAASSSRQRARHEGQREAAMRRGLGEAMAGQVGGDDGEVAGQQRQQAAPGMGGGAGAVEQQQDRPLPHLPGHASAGRRPGRSGWRRGWASRGRPGPSWGGCSSGGDPHGLGQGGGIGQGQRQVAGAHLGGEAARRPPAGGARCRPAGRCGGRRGRRGRRRSASASARGAAALAVAGDIGAAIGQQHHQRGLAAAAQRLGQQQRPRRAPRPSACRRRRAARPGRAWRGRARWWAAAAARRRCRGRRSGRPCRGGRSNRPAAARPRPWPRRGG